MTSDCIICKKKATIKEVMERSNPDIDKNLCGGHKMLLLQELRKVKP